MNGFDQLAESLAWGLWRASWQGGLLALVLIAASRLAGDRLSPRVRTWLWWLVAARFAWPVIVTLPLLPAPSWAVKSDTTPDPTPSVVMTSQPTAETRSLSVPETDAEVPPAATLHARTPTATPVATPTANPFPWRAILAAIWLSGVVLLTLPATVRFVRFGRRVRRMPILSDPDVVRLHADCAAALGVKPPTLRRADGVPQPALWPGMPGRASVLLPSDVLILPRRELRLVLRHELAHHVRRDALQRGVLWLLRAMHWFNPLAWLALRAVRADQELACDAVALCHADPDERNAYGRLLLRLLVGKPANISPATAMAAGRYTMQQLSRRLAMTQTPNRSNRAVTLLIAAPLALLGVAGAVDLVPGAAAEPSTQASTMAPAQPVTKSADRSDISLAAQLDVVPEDAVQFEQTPLPDVIDTLLSKQGINVFVNWNAMALSGIDRDVPITLGPLRNLTRRQVLDLVLQAAGGGFVELDFEVRDNVVSISTREMLESEIETRMFRLPPDKQDKEAVENVIQAVENFIEPETWKDNGGTIGSLQQVDGMLVIAHHRSTLDEIATFLGKLGVLADNAGGDIAASDVGPIKPGELLTVAVGDIVRAGELTVMTKRVTAEGTIDLLLIDPVQVGGMSGIEARKAIEKAYEKAQLLYNPTVGVARPALGETITGTAPTSAPAEPDPAATEPAE